jgi:hypothetical protein
MPEITFVAATDELKGKRAAIVARMIQMIVEAEGEPVTWDELTAGVEHEHQYTPALHALELVGAIERWEFVEPGKRRRSTAYSLAEGVEVTEEAIEKVAT